MPRPRNVLLAGTSALAVLGAVYFSYWQQEVMASLAAVRAANLANAATFVGRRAMVVGGTSGIGEGLAKRLAEGNYSVTVVGRSAERGNEIVSELKRVNPTGAHEFLPVNAFLLKNVEEAAQAYKAKHKDEPLDVLVVSQGIGTFQGRTETSEGIDEKLALHFYSRFAFIYALLPELRKSPSARVLSILTAGVHPPYIHFREDPELKTHYSLKNAADAGCMYNDFAMDAFAKKPENWKILFAHAAPGMVNTDLVRSMPAPLRFLSKALLWFGRTPAECAEWLAQPLLKSDADAAKAVAEAKGGLLLNQYGGPASKTSLHTDENVGFLYDHALEVMRRTGLKIRGHEGK